MADRSLDRAPDLQFSEAQLQEVYAAAALSEELVSDHFKLSAGQWLNRRYDLKTARQLTSMEAVEGPFAQVVRYEMRCEEAPLNSKVIDFYQICLQDRTILATLSRRKDIALFPFVLYIVSHELIHIVRFSKFLQNYEATENERFEEESRVHRLTRDILSTARLQGLEPVFGFFVGWQEPFESLTRS